jgi:uncharacterized protein (TIGR02453 family)
MSEFRGFPPELFAFFEALERDNSKSFWNQHKEVWEEHVRDPMRALLDQLAEEFGPLRMFRPNRDVRFSKDKSPYKLSVAATSEARAVGGIGYYIDLSASRLLTGFGAMALARDQLERFRAAIDDEQSGRAFVRLHHTMSRASIPLSPGIDPPLRTAPRGYPSDHPRVEFLRWKGAAVVQEYDRAAWMHTPETVDRVRTVWRGAAPLRAWLDAHVGASETPERARPARRSA